MQHRTPRAEHAPAVRLLPNDQHQPPHADDGQAAHALAEALDRLAAAHEEQARLSRRLLETQRLESLGLLAGGVAHDLNNLLTGIQGNADLAAIALEAGSPAQAYLAQIGMAVARASELTRQMLAYGGRPRAAGGTADINAAIDAIGELLRVSHTPDCSLRLSLAADLPQVAAEATQVRQIIMNLVLNAAEANGCDGGEIVLVTARDELGRAALDGLILGPLARPGPFVRLTVSDGGCGMEPETLARIFDPYFSTKLPGRGLGLASVHTIVRDRCGAILVQSAPGRGTTFLIWLPAAGQGC